MSEAVRSEYVFTDLYYIMGVNRRLHSNGSLRFFLSAV